MGVLIAVILTAYLALKRSWWVCLASMSVFTLLIVDAWFDVLTSPPGRQLWEALGLAVFVELPLAAVSLWLAYTVARELVAAR